MGSGASSAASGVAAHVRMWMNDRYEFGEKLGEGGFAQVREAWLRVPREPRAVKLIYMREATVRRKSKSSVDREKRRLARHEVAVWRLVGEHENVVRLYEAFSKDLVFYMVMERCEKTLMGALLDMPSTNEEDMLRIFREMILGVQHMHSLNVVHADIKLSNYLLGGPQGTTVKLADFGLAELLPSEGAVLEGQVGTDMYMSPEMVNEDGFTLSTDIWSLGVTVYLLLHGEFPYPDMASVGKGLPEPTYRRCDGQPEPNFGAAALAKRLLVRQRDLRCTAREALETPFLTRKAAVEAIDESEDDEKVVFRASLTNCFARARLLTQKVEEQHLDTQAQEAIEKLCRRAVPRSMSKVVATAAHDWVHSKPAPPRGAKSPRRQFGAVVPMFARSTSDCAAALSDTATRRAASTHQSVPASLHMAANASAAADAVSSGPPRGAAPMLLQPASLDRPPPTTPVQCW